MDPNKTTTLLLDKAFLPYSFLSARTAFLHLMKNNVRSFDAENNLIDSNLDWFAADIPLYEDQPFLRSKDKIWFVPTVMVVKSNFFYNRAKIPKNVSLGKLCQVYNYTCQICYNTFLKDDLTIEHVLPKSKGGTSGVENITLSCRACNQRKNSVYPYYNMRGKELAAVNLPLPFVSYHRVEFRQEWEKFFVYESKNV